MISIMRKSLMYGLLLTLILFVSACGENDDVAADDDGDDAGNSELTIEDLEEDPDPVTLQVVIHWEEDMFNHRFRDPITEAFPWITIEQIQQGAGRQEYEEMFARGENPDIFFELSYENLEYFEIEYDLDEMIDKYNYDVSHINPAMLEAMRARDPERRLLGMPYETVNWVLFYNKDIFDQFGQGYPTETMTWDETVELARKVTGEVEGVHYRGLDIGPHDGPLKQFPLNLSDPETGDVLLQDKPEFGRYMDLMKEIGDLDHSDDPFFNGSKFADDRTTAMFVEFVQAVEWWRDLEGLNYDVAPLPTWEKDPALTHRPDVGILHWSINPDSENLDAAFRVLAYFTETEYQTFASRIGLGPTSGEAEVLEQFFQAHDYTHDLSLDSVFVNESTSPPEIISPWDDYVNLNMPRWLNDPEYKQMDRNEYLRIVTEESEARIADVKGAQ